MNPKVFASSVLFSLHLFSPELVHAQECWSPGASGVTFSAVSPDKVNDSQGSIDLTCQSGSLPGFIRYCIYIGDSEPVPGIAPRWMTNYNGSQMAYNLYSDIARTKIVGPPPSGGGFPVYSSTLTLPGGYLSTSVSAQIYGRVPAGQVLPASTNYQSQIHNASIDWAFDVTAYPPSCSSGMVHGTTKFYLGTNATVATGCRLSSAADLDFGVASDLSTPRDQNSTIVVRCPLGVPWSVALNDGTHVVAGLRNMRASGGESITYELYKDAGRSQRWGSSSGGIVTGVGAGETVPQQLTVYGHIPNKATVTPGTYTDTVTATLTY